MSHDQPELFHDDIFDAMRADAEFLGGLKAVGSQLWPSKAPEQAARWLADCWNHDRPAKMDPEEFTHFLAIAVAGNAYCTTRYLGQRARLEFTRITKEAQQEDAAVRVEECLAQFKAAIRDWERAR